MEFLGLRPIGCRQHQRRPLLAHHHHHHQPLQQRTGGLNTIFFILKNVVKLFFLPQIFTTQVPVLMRENNNGLYGVDAFFLVNEEILISHTKQEQTLFKDLRQKQDKKGIQLIFAPFYIYT